MRWVAKIFHPTRLEKEMEEELRSHIEHRADDLERSGLTRAAAERRARVEFGARGRFKEECYEALGGNLVETAVQDARFSIRLLRKSPGFAVVAVLTLALAIGANAVVFGVMNGLILRPLNVPDAGTLWGTEYGADKGFESYPNYLDLRDRNRSFESLAAFRFAFVGLDTGNDPVLASGFAATGNYFDTLRIQPYLGRFFHASDEQGPNSAPYLVLSYSYWQTRFQGDRNVLGRVVRLNKHPFTVVGVAPPGFHGTLLFVAADFFMPIVNQEQVDGENLLKARGSDGFLFESFGHLKPGITYAQAVADVNAVGAYLRRAYPKEFADKNTVLDHPGLTAFHRPVAAFVAALMLLAGLILLAACANLGSLFTARAADRTREVALRLALGSSRNRILRTLLTEATIISLVGGALGLWGSVELLRGMTVWDLFPNIPLHIPVSPDLRVYVIAIALALVSGFLFGSVPVRQVLRTDPYEIVKAGSKSTERRRITTRDVLLVLQIAICAVLVTSSIVALRGFVRSLRSKLGFEPGNTILVNLNLAMAGYSGAKVPAMQRRMIDAIKTIPGVERVGLVLGYPPLVDAAAQAVNVFKDESRDLRPATAADRPYAYWVSPGYFNAAGTNLKAGRDFSWHDDKNAPFVAAVNQEFARKMFGSPGKALGRYFRLQDGSHVQVVGVVEDGKYMSLTEDQEPAIFLSFLQSPSSLAHVVVRWRGDPQQHMAAIRSKLREIDSGLPCDTQTWNNQLNVVLFPAHMATVALGVLGIMGAMLSITGIFGMAAYSVSKRLKELGIRLALGARHKEVLQAALGRPVKLLAIGSGSGLILGVLASRVLASIVYQATPRDPAVLAGVVVAMALIGLVATWIPAQRALSLDPAALLREE